MTEISALFCGEPFADSAAWSADCRLIWHKTMAVVSAGVNSLATAALMDFGTNGNDTTDSDGRRLFLAACSHSPLAWLAQGSRS